MSEKIVCRICGKTLTRNASQTAEIGHRCDSLLAEGWTKEKLTTHYATLTGAIPNGYITLADLGRKIEAQNGKIKGLTVSKLVKAIGKDRAVESAAHPICRPIYAADARHTRWVNPWLATPAGMKAIATGDFSKAPTS